MRTKQLAHVLITILGLSVVLHRIPLVLNGLFLMTRVPQGIGGNYWYNQFRLWKRAEP